MSRINEKSSKNKSFITSKKSKVAVFGEVSVYNKNLISYLLSLGKDVAYILDDDNKTNYIQNVPLGSYVIETSDELLKEYIKISNTFVFYFPTKYKYNDNTVNNFLNICNIIEEVNKNINIIFISSIEVYGTKRDEILFTDSVLKPDTRKGMDFAIMEQRVADFENFKIIRIPELFTEETKKEIIDFLEYLKSMKAIVLPSSNKNYINILSESTLFFAISKMLNYNKPIIINLTDIPNLTFQDFVSIVGKAYMGKEVKFSKIPSMFLPLPKAVPEFFKHNQNLSTIEQEGLGINKYYNNTQKVEIVLKNIE